MAKNGLEFIVTENPLTKDKEGVDSFIVRAVNQKLIPYEDILRKVHDLSALRIDAIDTALRTVRKVLIDEMAEGGKPEIPLGVFRAGPKGTMEAADVDFSLSDSTNNHTIQLYWRPDKGMEEEIRKRVRLVRNAEHKERAPHVLSWFDTYTDSKEATSAYHVLYLKGKNLQVDKGAEDEGVFWIAADGTEVKSERLAINNPTFCLPLVPELAPGVYELEVRTRLGNHKLRESDKIEVTIV